MQPLNLRVAIGALLLAIAASFFTPVAADAASPLEESEIRALLVEAMPSWAVEPMVKIALCESDYVPAARAFGWDKRYGWYEYRGILQVDPVYHQWRANRLFGYGASLYDPRVNAGVAAEILHEQGWRAWPVCARRAGVLR